MFTDGSDASEQLLAAVLEGDLPRVCLALERGANPNCSYDEADDVLGVAVLSGNAPIVKKLLDAGANPWANPNVRRWDGNTPLYWAVKQSRLDLVK